MLLSFSKEFDVLLTVQVRVNTMVRSKELSEAFQKENCIDSVWSKKFRRPQKDLKTIWNQPFHFSENSLEMEEIENYCQHDQVWLSSRFTKRAAHKTLKEVYKNPKMSSQDLEQAPAAVDVKVHVSTIRAWASVICMGGVKEQKMKARLKFARQRAGLVE